MQILGVGRINLIMKSKSKNFNKAKKSTKKMQDSADKRKKVASPEASETEKEIAVDFEFFNMSEIDFHSVKQFLMVAFGATGHSINISEMATLITEECADHVGTTLKTDGEQSDPLAITTCIPLALASSKAFLNDMMTFLLSKTANECPSLLEYLQGDKSQSSALIIHERFINWPAGIAGPILDNLVSDWKKARSEESRLFWVDYVLFLTPTFHYVKSSLDEETNMTPADGDNDGRRKQGAFSLSRGGIFRGICSLQCRLQNGNFPLQHRFSPSVFGKGN